MSLNRHQKALEHAQAGRLQQAFQLYGELLNENKDDSEALHFFAVLDIHQKNYQQAYDKTRRIRTLRPDWAKACNTHGSACYELGRIEEACAAFEKGLELEPDNNDLMKNLASLFYQEGKFAKAYHLFVQIAQHDPLGVQSQLDVIECERQLGQLDQALQKAQLLAERKPQIASVQNAIGNIYKQKGQGVDAIARYEKALSLDKTNGLFYGNLGATLIDLGKPDEARFYLMKSIELAPAHCEPYYLLSRNLQSYEDARHLISLVEGALQNEYLNDRSRSDLEFALYGAFHYMKEDETAFDHLTVANGLRKNESIFDLARLQQTFREIQECDVTNVTLKPDIIETPIFILGMPRSGTTLVEQIITSHSDVTGGGELPDLGRIAHRLKYPCDLGLDQLLNAREGYLQSTGMTGKVFFTDKMPGNFQYIGLIKAIWPHAKIIHCKRHPMDTCLSNYQMRFSAGHDYNYDLEMLGGYYRAYWDLMTHWMRRFGDEIYTCEYEKLVIDQEGESRTLLAYCGLEWQEDCLEFYKSEKSVRTASATQVRRQIYTSALDRWKRYEKQLAPLQAALGDLVVV